MAAAVRKPDLTDVTDEQWALVPPLIPLARPGGRPRAVDMREVITTLRDRNRTGGPWDMLPHDRRPTRPVDDDVSPWRDGTWPPIRAALRADVRPQQAPAQEPPPRAASLDSHAVKTTAQGGERGAEGGQTMTGRTRHVSVDGVGLRWGGLVSSAALDDAVAAPQVRKHVGLAMSPRLEGRWADPTDPHHGLNAWIAPASQGHWRVEMVRRPAGSTGFVLGPTRWVVARTCAGRGRCRRHRKDAERRTDSSESMWRVSAIHLMRQRLQPSNADPPFRDRVAA